MALSGALAAKIDVEAMDATILRNQIESPLLRLPAELRNQIWELAFKVDSIQFLPKLRALPEYCTMARLSSTRVEYAALSNLHNITRTCHQIYAETNAMIFGLNVLVASIHSVEAAINRLPEKVQATVQTFRVIQYPSTMYLPNSEISKRLQPLKRLPALKKVIAPRTKAKEVIEELVGPNATVDTAPFLEHT